MESSINIKGLSLFASCANINCKSEQFYELATTGEILPIYSESTTLLDAFWLHLIGIVSTGKDFVYQPRMRAGEKLRGGNILLYSERKFTGNNIFVLQPAMGFRVDEIATYIGQQADELACRFVIIPDAQQIFASNLLDGLSCLNKVCREHDLLAVCGFNAIDGLQHIHNVCTLSNIAIKTIDEVGMIYHNFIDFQYGWPEQKHIIYALDENEKKLVIPENGAKLFLIERLAKTFLQKPVNIKQFTNYCFGALHGEFKKDTIERMISLSVENGILVKSGTGNKSVIALANCDCRDTVGRKPYKNNISITSLTDIYDKSTNHTRKRKALVKFGEFKMLFADSDTGIDAERFTMGLMKSILFQTDFLDFKIKTCHRNCLVICLSQKDDAKNQIQNELGDIKDSTLNIIHCQQEKSDSDIIYLLKTSLSQFQPDFVFVTNIENIKPQDFTPRQLINELSQTARAKGIVLIAHTSKRKANYLYELENNESWVLRSMNEPIDLDEICRLSNTQCPDIKLFEAFENGFKFLSRFRINNFGALVSASSKDIKRAFLMGCFYWCSQDDYNVIFEDDDCTGMAWTKRRLNNALNEARKLGLISLTYDGIKKYENCKVTFIKK